MNQESGNYPQNYYENTTENYANYFENEMDEYQANCGDAPNLRVPDARLYAEGFQDMADVYAGNSQYYESPLSTDAHYRRPAVAHTTQQMEYYPEYFGTQPENQPASNFYQMRQCNQYSNYLNALPHNLTNSSYNTYAKEEDYMPNVFTDPYNIENNLGTHPRKMHTCNLHYNKQTIDSNAIGSQFAKEEYIDYRKKKYYGYGSKVSRGAAVKKYPVTVKTPKYITKNFAPASINKRPSALCLPVVTQPDPALVKRKSKTNQQIKKNLDQFNFNEAHSAHKMHSQGDVKSHLPPERFETFLNEFEDEIELNETDGFYGAEQQNTEVRDNVQNIKEFTKFLKPRVPSSIKIMQEKQAKITTAKALQPRLKLSLDKLLNRLQKCENNDHVEECQENQTSVENKDVDTNKLKSFNYEEISRKCSPKADNEDKGPDINRMPNKQTNALFGPLEKKRSVRMIKAMDDHCALDLHRSKSYIVDLIDRALSKELGTVPRDQSMHYGLTPNKAVATISRHRQSCPKELCYEVTAALTDSIISNATAPNFQSKENTNQVIGLSTSDGQIQGQMCEDNYIKQLKQLRWGHIRHIQHEARKLADLEEFLEKCGEIEY